MGEMPEGQRGISSINNMNPEEAFQKFIAQENLEDPSLLLMISGGVDSCVLLEISAKFCKPENLQVLHINHQTRNNCEDDAMFVQKICSEKNIPCHVKKIAPVNKNKESVWREQRQQLASEFNVARVLTAHHATDLVETMLFRLTKGCGIEGLSPFDTSTKPFWKIPKADLLDYAQKNNISWREDESNQDETHQRNIIRHQVLPALRKITPNLEKVFVRESKNFSEIQEYIHQQTPTDTSLDLAEFLTWPIILQKSYLRQRAQKNISSADLEDCLKWLHNNPPGKSQKSLGKTSLQILSGKIVF